MLLQAYHGGFEVGRYVSLERIIEDNKDRYYETLELSSKNWHEKTHDPWPYIQFVLYIFKIAYKEFEDRLVQSVSIKGEKSQLVIDTIDKMIGHFTLKEIQIACPGVSIDLIRYVLKDLRANGIVECSSKGQFAKWKKI
jgi:hypothetical protein